jgi:hypothetical protein
MAKKSVLFKKEEKTAFKDAKEFWSFIKNHRYLREIKRNFWFLFLAGIVLFPDSSRKVVVWSFAVFSLVIVFSHLTRKLIFNYLDIEDMTKKIEDNALASAIVISSIIGFTAVLMLSLVFWLK